MLAKHFPMHASALTHIGDSSDLLLSFATCMMWLACMAHNLSTKSKGEVDYIYCIALNSKEFKPR